MSFFSFEKKIIVLSPCILLYCTSIYKRETLKKKKNPANNHEMDENTYGTADSTPMDAIEVMGGIEVMGCIEVMDGIEDMGGIEVGA